MIQETATPTNEAMAGPRDSEVGLSPEELLRRTTLEGDEAIANHGGLQDVVKEVASVFRVLGTHTPKDQAALKAELEFEINRSKDLTNTQALEPFWQWLRDKADQPESYIETGERLSSLNEALRKDASQKFPQGRQEY